jgi:O-antigen/teichoic acid export membrane protein
MTATFSLSMHVVRYFFLKGVLPELRLAPRYVDWARVRPLTSLSWWFLISQLSGVVILRIDLVVVAATLSIEDVAVYAVAAKLAQFCMRAFRDLSSVFLPHATSLFHGGEAERIPEIQIDGTRASVLMAMPILLVLTMFGDAALEAWVGDGFADAIPVLTFLTLAAGMRSAIEPTFALLNATGRVRTVALTVMCEAVLNISLSLLLVMHLDLVGPALGTLVASVVVTLPVFLTSFRWLGASRSEFVRRSLLPHLPPALVTGALLLALDLLLPTGRFWIFLVAPAAFMTYMVTYWKISATPAERERVRSAVERVRRSRTARGADS